MAKNHMSTADDAAKLIRRLIFDGELRPGDRVPQDDIAATLGISRIPVREALIRLEADGLITIELYRGAFVNPIDEYVVRDHYGLYGLVFGYAARLTIERADVAAVSADLDRVLADLARAEDAKDFTRLTRDFHGVVLNACGSARVRNVSASLSGIIPGDFFTLVPDAMPVEREGLPIIAAALAAKDADTAADTYLDVMRQVGEVVVELFATRGLLAEAPSR